MSRGNPHFVRLKSINGEPMLVNISAMRTVTTINLAGDEVGVISFDKEHEIVIGSTVADVINAMAQPRIPLDP
ncbi:hypothetical protein AB2M62_07185 [Sphingomonas sp. MMS12-HWE2-04]|uniref:hypothetical protein n=1 Tax=Sphingomonas sp. MMS12-HWE2-04 TaxID=3234199 RepID=UPI00384D7661